MVSQPDTLDIVWTVPAIARVIGRTPRATYNLLENNRVAGAKKIGGRWCLAPREFYASVATASAPAA